MHPFQRTITNDNAICIKEILTYMALFSYFSPPPLSLRDISPTGAILTAAEGIDGGSGRTSGYFAKPIP